MLLLRGACVIGWASEPEGLRAQNADADRSRLSDKGITDTFVSLGREGAYISQLAQENREIKVEGRSRGGESPTKLGRWASCRSNCSMVARSAS
jgi:hypothetical protein